MGREVKSNFRNAFSIQLQLVVQDSTARRRALPGLFLGPPGEPGQALVNSRLKGGTRPNERVRHCRRPQRLEPGGGPTTFQARCRPRYNWERASVGDMVDFQVA